MFPENTISDGRVHAFRGGAYQAAFYSNSSGILEQSVHSFLGPRQQETCTLPAPWVPCPNGESCCPAEDPLCVRSLTIIRFGLGSSPVELVRRDVLSYNCKLLEFRSLLSKDGFDM
jgi:hypothetical protein